jgi:N6-adenosine-specific RNA methylase IME4
MKYEVLLADPPWRQTKGGLRKTRPNQGKELDYPTLDLSDIKNIISKVDAPILFLWTIDKFLFEAQQIAEEIGYKLHARIIWDKENGVAPAFTVRYSHEYLLWMYKSPMKKIDKEMRGKFTTVLREKSGRHSAKPTIAYTMIESLYPQSEKIELFARKKRKGWSSWGNEIENDIDLKF